MRALVLGGQKSGKTAYAEQAAARWLQQSPAHQAVYIATALPWDAEMQQRIARHQQERLLRVPDMQTVQASHSTEPLNVIKVLQNHNQPQTLVVLDCLTLWLTQQLQPLHGEQQQADIAGLLDAIAHRQGPLYIVGNEIGLGVIPMEPATRQFVDALGQLNQRVAAVCQQVTLMVAGVPLVIKQETPCK